MIQFSNIYKQVLFVLNRNLWSEAQSQLTLPSLAFVLFCMSITSLGIFLRLDALDARVLFLDESIHWQFMDELMRLGTYAYDPVYHGPFIYYLGTVFFKILQTFDVFTLRLPIAIFSVLTLLILYGFKDELGKWGLLTALSLASVSTSLVYFSNLANYENYFLFFTLLLVLFLLKGLKYRNPWFIGFSILCLAFMYVTKEAAIVNFGVIIVAHFVTYIIFTARYRPSVIIKDIEEGVMKIFSFEFLKNSKYHASLCIISTFCILAVGVFLGFYSSFGNNWQGVFDGLSSLIYWVNTGADSGHIKPFDYYYSLLVTYEFPLVWFGFIGAVIVIISRKAFYTSFLAVWALGMFLAYSIIPYKTPWLVINIVLPLTIVTGLGVDHFLKTFRWKGVSVLYVVLLGVLVLNSFTSGIKAKYIENSKESLKLSYVHTYDRFYETVNLVHGLALFDNRGVEMPISIATPDYWPLPVYLWDFTRVGYFNGVKGRNINLNSSLIIVDTEDDPELQEFLLEESNEEFVKFMTIPQRPGVMNTIFVERDLLNRYIKGGGYQALTTLWTDFRKSRFAFHQTYYPVFQPK